MTIELKENERLDDLQRNGFQIIQKTDGFCFGMDAVLLSGFASVRKGEKALDLGTGTGIIPILLKAKTEGEHFSALEIQEEMADMARRSVAANHLETDITVVTGDIKEASRIFGAASFDVVTSNPPYMNDAHGLKNPDLPKAIARHEVLCTLDDVTREAAKVLKPGGRFITQQVGGKNDNDLSRRLLDLLGEELEQGDDLAFLRNTPQYETLLGLWQQDNA